MNDAKSSRFILTVTPEFLGRIDDWRRQQPDLPSRAEAIRRLVEKGIAHWSDPDRLEGFRS